MIVAGFLFWKGRKRQFRLSLSLRIIVNDDEFVRLSISESDSVEMLARTESGVSQSTSATLTITDKIIREGKSNDD